MAEILYGKTVAAPVQAALKEQIAALAARGKRLPGLAVVSVGGDAASARYLRGRARDCAAVGIRSVTRHFDAITEAALLREIAALNTDAAVDGILVQLPLPDALDTARVLSALDPAKDVDGLHPLTVGRLYSGQATFIPCTAKGIMRLLDAAGLSDLAGKHAVVVGRSQIVGRPVAELLLEQNATVTLCHSKTPDLAEEVARADIVVAATGHAHLISGEWIKPGALVIDAGITRDAAGKLTGDVAFDTAKQRAAAITPVPGGVGPVTRAMLLENTMQAYQLHTAD